MITFPPFASDVALARRIINALETLRAPRIIQYVFLAQADYESNFDANAKGDYLDDEGHLLPWSARPTGKPSAYGTWQHEIVRLNKYKAATGLDIHAAVMAGTNTIEADAALLMWELKTFPTYGYAEISAAKTVREGAIIACQKFEIATTSASDRGTRAEQWLLELK